MADAFFRNRGNGRNMRLCVIFISLGRSRNRGLHTGSRTKPGRKAAGTVRLGMLLFSAAAIVLLLRRKATVGK